MFLCIDEPHQRIEGFKPGVICRDNLLIRRCSVLAEGMRCSVMLNINKIKLSLTYESIYPDISALCLNPRVIKILQSVFHVLIVSM